MSERPTMPEVQLKEKGPRPDSLSTLPMWTKVLLGLAVVVMVGGLVLWGLGAVRGDEPVAQQHTSNLLEPTSLAGTDGAAMSETGSSSGASDYGPALFRLGFSFVAGFAMAWTVRAFLKLALLLGGMILLAIFGLQYAGVLEMDWSATSDHFDTLTGWLGEQTAGFREFVVGALPSAASAGAGMIAGFRRR